MWRIRRGREEDYDAVVGLWVNAGLGEPTDDEWRAITIGSCARLLVADEDGRVLGAGVVAFDGWRAYIYHIAVNREERNRGVGRGIIAAAEQHVRHEGGTRMFAFVHQENEAGLALTASSGYVSEGDIGFVKELKAG
jgi:ribosomal protein S18 acetylase RimI-like enzyme